MSFDSNTEGNAVVVEEQDVESNGDNGRFDDDYESERQPSIELSNEHGDDLSRSNSHMEESAVPLPEQQQKTDRPPMLRDYAKSPLKNSIDDASQDWAKKNQGNSNTVRGLAAIFEQKKNETAANASAPKNDVKPVGRIQQDKFH